MSNEDPYQEKARIALEKYRRRMMYADIQVLKAGDYEKLANRLCFQSWSALVGSLLSFGWSIVGFILGYFHLFGFEHDGFGDFIYSNGIASLVLGSILLFLHYRIKKTRQYVVKLMEASREAAGLHE